MRGGVAWTMVYDTIYAMQDQRDDAIIGVRSTARRFAAAPRRWLSLFAALALAAWALAGHLAGAAARPTSPSCSPSRCTLPGRSRS